ncbi:hypothetical protein [Deinococcus koreensis]|uniref:Carboxypeptidase regulatory-like domain-containing protein n=1 Tax=Deinococcus koreensis TaxID=2054903 RepID=A0A2K3USA9_9DEIO|nr:hypothetical protein [Deinococcus koreensis]PNY79431.1 hypothetical protein CVO96_18495 [Deinococcus koreensis]
MNNVTPVGLTTLTLSLGLVACGTSSLPTPQPDPAGLTDQVSGRVVGWTAGTATVEAQARPEGSTQATDITLSSGTVGADGTFSLTLPGAAAVAPYLTPTQQTPRAGCTGVFTQSVREARLFGIGSFALRRADRSYIGFLTQDGPNNSTPLKAGNYFIVRYYADQAFTVTGTLDCPGSRISLNLNLKQGWNAAVNTVDAVSAEGRITANTISTVGLLPPSKF